VPFVKGKPKPKGSGRRAGARNKRTIAQQGPVYPDALKHLADVMSSTDGTITPDLKLRAAIGLAAYQNSKPATPKPTTPPIEFDPPSNAQEARDLIVKITAAIARNEVDSAHGGVVLSGLQMDLNAKAAELEIEVLKHKAEDEGGL
jgi:hypothetical protein